MATYSSLLCSSGLRQLVVHLDSSSFFNQLSLYIAQVEMNSIFPSNWESLVCTYEHLVDFYSYIIYLQIYRIGGVMDSVLTSSAVDRGFEPRSGKTKDYKIGICCFPSKHAALRRKSKDRLARNQDNVSEWGDMYIHRLLPQWASTIKIQLSMLVLYKVDLIIISLKINLSSPWYSWKIAELALNNNYSITHSILLKVIQ